MSNLEALLLCRGNALLMEAADAACTVIALLGHLCRGLALKVCPSCSDVDSESDSCKQCSIDPVTLGMRRQAGRPDCLLQS